MIFLGTILLVVVFLTITHVDETERTAQDAALMPPGA